MEFSSSKNLIDSQTWRYATKKFDASKKLSPETWSNLEHSLILTPSSYGLQPWQFLIVQNPEIRKRLREKSWNQSQIEDCSQLVVFTALKTMTEDHINEYIMRMSEVRGVPVDSLAGFKKAVMGDAVLGPRAKISAEWNARQCYIALGNLMTSAALLGVDTCPLEGLDPLAYDDILGLQNSPYKTIVACAVGYRHAEDKYATAPKVRFSKDRLVKIV